MSVKQVFGGSGEDPSALDTGAFATIVAAIIVGWILVSLWLRVVENFAFQTLGMSSRSTVHALIIAIIATIAFLAFVWVVDEYEIIPSTSASGVVEGATEGLISGTQGGGGGGASSAITNQLTAGVRRGQPTVIQPLNFFGV